jgi:hypothetical protein
MQKLGGGVATAPEMQMKVPFFSKPFVSSRRAKRERVARAVHKHANTAANSRGAVIYLDFTANKVRTQSGWQSCSNAEQKALFSSIERAAVQSIPHQRRATIEKAACCCVRADFVLREREQACSLFVSLFVSPASRADGILGALRNQIPIYCEGE